MRRLHRAALALLALPALAATGACSRSELAGAGECPAPAAMIRSGDDAVAIATVDDKYVYWFRTGSEAALRKAPRCGGEASPIPCGAAPCAPAWRAIAASGTAAGSVYFVDREGSILVVSRDGGAPMRLAEKAMPLALVASAGELLWMDASTGFHSVPLDVDGADPAALGPPDFASLGQARTFVADDTSIYWLASSDGSLPPALYRMPRRGGTPTMMVAGGARLGAPTGSLALDGSDLYFTGWGGDIAAVPRAGGAVRTVASYQNPIDLAVTANDVFWSDASQSQSLRRVGKSGGQSPSAAGGPAGASAPIADGDSVWVDDGKDLFRVGE